MGALHQTLEIIFEAQRKKSNEKNFKIKISFPTYKTPPSLWTRSLFKPHNFFISFFILNDLKCYRNAIRSFTIHL